MNWVFAKFLNPISNRSLIYLSSTTLGCADIGTRKFEFVAKIQLRCNFFAIWFFLTAIFFNLLWNKIYAKSYSSSNCKKHNNTFTCVSAEEPLIENKFDKCRTCRCGKTDKSGSSSCTTHTSLIVSTLLLTLLSTVLVGTILWLMWRYIFNNTSLAIQFRRKYQYNEDDFIF